MIVKMRRYPKNTTTVHLVIANIHREGHPRAHDAGAGGVSSSFAFLSETELESSSSAFLFVDVAPFEPVSSLS